MLDDLLAYLLNTENEDDIDDLLLEQYGISYDNLESLIKNLMPLLEVGSSPITKKNYIGFANKKEKLWLMKTELTPS